MPPAGKEERKRNTSNSAGMKWHTANTIWTNGLWGEAPEWAAFTLGELPHQLVTPTVDPLPGTEGSVASGSQNPATGEDVEMQDDIPLGAVGGEGATGGDSPVNKEDEALLDEEETPQTQVISDMRNLTVRSPPNPTPSQSETKL